MFKDLQKIKDLGFIGFKTVEELMKDNSSIPNERGIYLIINPECSKNDFIIKGDGGFFKGKDPNVSINELSLNWVDDCHVLYIGQAGGASSSATLRKRLRQYLDFGKGKPVGHYGGRLIWQLSHNKDLIIAWKCTGSLDPREEEKKLINDFSNHYSKLPFANLRF